MTDEILATVHLARNVIIDRTRNPDKSDRSWLLDTVEFGESWWPVRHIADRRGDLIFVPQWLYNRKVDEMLFRLGDKQAKKAALDDLRERVNRARNDQAKGVSRVK